MSKNATLTESRFDSGTADACPNGDARCPGPDADELSCFEYHLEAADRTTDPREYVSEEDR